MEWQNAFFNRFAPCIKICFGRVEVFREGGFGKINKDLIVFLEGTGG